MPSLGPLQWKTVLFTYITRSPWQRKAQFVSFKTYWPNLVEANSYTRQPPQLQFDRVVGNFTAPSSILYADITSPTFGKFHRTLVGTAREGKSSYRIRHRKPLSYDSKPLAMSGYGVELALKRTDYIVIDDRDEGDAVPAAKQVESEVSLEDEEIADLKPLSTSELSSLSVKAAGFVMQTTDPFLTLIKLSQDFPKFSSIVATQNASFEFVKEHVNNRALMVPAGMNIMWINGLQITDRQIDAFGLLDFLRRERKLIRGVQELGLTGPEAVSLLAHPDIAVVKAEDDTQRFDWRDSSEAGNVIIWLNDIEKDKRYEGWPSELRVVSKSLFMMWILLTLYSFFKGLFLDNCRRSGGTSSILSFQLICQTQETLN